MRDASTKSHVILFAEDDPADQLIFRRAMERGASAARVFVAGDGAEALDFLNRRGRFADPHSSPRPDLVLLDLNMPKIDGRGVARQLRADPRFKSLRLVALTTSSDPKDIEDCYALGFDSYIVKPAEIVRLQYILETVVKYWFEVVELPPARA